MVLKYYPKEMKSFKTKKQKRKNVSEIDIKASLR